MVARTVVILASLTLGLSLGSSAQAAHAAGVIPTHGIFVVGKTLAGVGLGYTETQVKAHWGGGYTLCTLKPLCTVAQPVWLFETHVGEPVGVAVRFRNGKAASIFTLGTPGVSSLSAGGGGGWKTAEGLKMFDPISTVDSFYAAATIDTNCSYYSAISMRQGAVTSSFYISTGTVYGFALSAQGEPICN